MSVVTITGAPFANGYVPTIDEWNTNIFGALSASINDISYSQISASTVDTAVSANSTNKVPQTAAVKTYVDNQISNLQITQENYRIISGNADVWGTPNFLLSGSSNDFSCVSGLTVYINGTSLTLSATQYASGLTLASAGVSATISAAIYNSSAFTKTEGEFGDTVIIIDGYQSAFTASSRLDSMQAFKHGTEFFLGKLTRKSSAAGELGIEKCKRGIGASDRSFLTDNDTVYLLEANYVFLNSDGSISATTLPPKYQATDPGAGTAGEFYFNTTSKVWKRYSGSWTQNNAILLGAVVCDQSGVVAIDHEDFDLAWDSVYEADIYPIMEGTSAISAVSAVSAIGININKISVAGRQLYMPNPRELVLSSTLLSSLTLASATLYNLYLTPLGEFYFDTVQPRKKGRKKGFYHPQYYWRCISVVYTDSTKYVYPFQQDNDEYEYIPNGTGSADSDPTAAATYPVSLKTISSELSEYKAMPPYVFLAKLWGASQNNSVIYSKKRNSAFYNYLFYQGAAAAYVVSPIETKTMQNSTMVAKVSGSSGNIAVRGFKVQF